MKAGTTTLYRDLLTHPSVFFPVDKEPNALCDDDVLTEAGRAAYAAMFAPSAPGSVCGEASTAYTKLPTFADVPRRALALLGPNVKLIYVVRHPIRRLISQHHHDFVRDFVPRDIGQAVREHPELLDYSRYSMQLEPWLETFGDEAVHLVRFEDFVGDRPAHVAAIEQFLGLDPRPELVDVSKVFNRSERKPAARGLAYRLSLQGWYRRLIRPLLPLSLKDTLRQVFLPKAEIQPAPPSAQTLAWLVEQFEPDQQRLMRLMGRTEPYWNLHDADDANAASPVQAERS